MSRPPQDVTDAELAILEVLWERGSATVREIAEQFYSGYSAAQGNPKCPNSMCWTNNPGATETLCIDYGDCECNEYFDDYDNPYYECVDFDDGSNDDYEDACFHASF